MRAKAAIGNAAKSGTGWLRDHFIPTLLATIAVAVLLGGLGWLIGITDAVVDLINGIGDLVTTDAMLWHVLLITTVASSLTSGAIFLVWRRPRELRDEDSAASGGERKTPLAVDYASIAWPLRTTWYMGEPDPRFSVDPPMCPDDRSALGVVFSDESTVPLPSKNWSNLKQQDMLFGCFKCDRRYDLRKSPNTMSELIAIVKGLALGEFRQSRRQAE